MFPVYAPPPEQLYGTGAYTHCKQTIGPLEKGQMPQKILYIILTRLMCFRLRFNFLLMLSVRVLGREIGHNGKLNVRFSIQPTYH